jgi:hypothetical protein
VVDKLIHVEVAAVEVEVTDVDSSAVVAVVFIVELVRSAVVVGIVETSVSFVVVAWGIVGPLLNVKLIVVDISVTSVDLWDGSGVELFGNVAEVGVVETSAAIELEVDVEITVVELAVVDSSDDFMEVVSIVGWFVTDVSMEVAAEVSKVLVVVEMVEKASFVLGVETVVSGGEAVVDSEDVLVESISVIEIFDTLVDVRIAEVKPLVAAVGVSLENVSGEFAVVEWMFVGVVPDTKLLVDEISVASVDSWDECAVELFGNAADVGVVETSAALVVVKLVVVGAVVGVDMAIGDPSDDFMEVVTIVG